MAINKVEYGGNTLIDITDTTATAADVLLGKYFYGNDGEKKTGTAYGWTKLGSTELTVSTTGTSAASAGSITIGSSAVNKSKIIYVRIRDKAGKRKGYFLGSDNFIINYRKANNSTSACSTLARVVHNYSSSGSYGISGSGYGVYAYSITNAGVINIYKRYNSSYSLTIDGTYTIEVYSLDYPDGKSVYDI